MKHFIPKVGKKCRSDFDSSVCSSSDTLKSEKRVVPYKPRLPNKSKSYTEPRFSKILDVMVKVTPIEVSDINGTWKLDASGEIKEIKKSIAPNVTKELKEELLDTLMEDDISNTILNDDLILKFAQERFDGIKNGSKKFDPYYYSNLDVIRQDLRRAARLLNAFRQVTKQTNLTLLNIYDHQWRSFVPEVAKILSNNYENPHVLDKMKALLGHLVRAASLDLSVHDFRDLEVKRTQILNKWQLTVNKHTHKAKSRMNMEKKDLQPEKDDLIRLNEFIKNQFTRYLKKINENYTYQDYLMLVRLTLTRITLFNHRRSGEVARLTIEQYEKRETNPDLTRSQHDLTDLQLELAKSMEVITLKDALKKLLSVRRKFTSLNGNKFVFGTNGSKKVAINGYKAIRFIIQKSGIENIDAFTAGKFRKKIATDIVWMNLSDIQKKLLLSQLGHTAAMHENVYDQNITSKIAKFALIPEMLTRFECNEECENKQKLTDGDVLREARKRKMLNKESESDELPRSKKQHASSISGYIEQSHSKDDDKFVVKIVKLGKNKKQAKPSENVSRSRNVNSFTKFSHDTNESSKGDENVTALSRKQPIRSCKKMDEYFSAESDEESNFSSSTEEYAESCLEDDDEFFLKKIKRRTRKKQSIQRFVRWTENMNKILQEEFQEELKNADLPIRNVKLDICRKRFECSDSCKEVSRSSIKCTLRNIRKGQRKI